MPINPAYLHLLLDPIPVVGVPFGLLALVVALMMNRREFVRFSLLLFVGLAISTILVYLTGEPAERLVEYLPGVWAAAISRHRDAGLWSLAGVETLGFLAAAGLFGPRRGGRVPGRLVLTIVVGALAVTGLVAWTTHTGQQVRHPEASLWFQPPAH